MKTKRVNRYYCDHCNKGGCSAGHMKTHERHCTANPNRACRMCTHMEAPATDLASLVAMLPRADDFRQEENHEFGDSVSYPGLDGAVKSILPDLREAANYCPMCIFAALRQRGILPYTDGGFDLKSELKTVWGEINAAERERDERSCLDG